MAEIRYGPVTALRIGDTWLIRNGERVAGPERRRMTEEQSRQLENWFTYHPPKPGQVKRYEDIRDFGRIFAALITDNCPDGTERDAAVLKVREAVMLANASIACGEADG